MTNNDDNNSNKFDKTKNGFRQGVPIGPRCLLFVGCHGDGVCSCHNELEAGKL